MARYKPEFWVYLLENKGYRALDSFLWIRSHIWRSYEEPKGRR